MKRLLALWVLVFVGMISANLFAGCMEPAPVELPEGSQAPSQEMMAAQQAVKQYLADIELFLTCLDDEDENTTQALTEEQKKANVILYNSVVEKVKVIVQEFNAQLRIYKEVQAQ